MQHKRPAGTGIPPRKDTLPWVESDHLLSLGALVVGPGSEGFSTGGGRTGDGRCEVECDDMGADSPDLVGREVQMMERGHEIVFVQMVESVSDVCSGSVQPPDGCGSAGGGGICVGHGMGGGEGGSSSHCTTSPRTVNDRSSGR